MSKIIILVFAFFVSCSTSPSKTPSEVPVQAKDFSRGEVILATQLLAKVFDEDMAPLSCVPDTEEAALLLRTIRPRMEVVEDDIGALLDSTLEVTNLIKTCDQNCTCGYIDDLLREHLVNLSKAERKIMNEKKSEKEINRCLSYAANTFCQGELYKELNKEKADFSFDEEAP